MKKSKSVSPQKELLILSLLKILPKHFILLLIIFFISIIFLLVAGILRYFVVGIASYYIDLFTGVSLLFIFIYLFCFAVLDEKGKSKNKIYSVISMLLFVLIIIFVFYYSMPLILDLPNALFDNCFIINGTCTYVQYVSVHKGPNKLKFGINNENFETDTSYAKSMTQGQDYEVKYLPHSRFVISIYKQ